MRISVCALVCLAVLGTCWGTSPALATEPVEILDEAEASHCNPCEIVLEGESRIFVENPLVVATSCEDVLEAEIYEDGSGHLVSVTNFNHPNLAGGCIVKKCNGLGEPPTETEWPFQLEAHPSGGVEFGIVLCFDFAGNPNATGKHCPISAQIGESGSSHHYVVDVDNHHCIGANWVYDATWEIHNSSNAGNHDAIEILGSRAARTGR